jgi:hypothetical protein
MVVWFVSWKEKGGSVWSLWCLILLLTCWWLSASSAQWRLVVWLICNDNSEGTVASIFRKIQEQWTALKMEIVSFLIRWYLFDSPHCTGCELFSIVTSILFLILYVPLCLKCIVQDQNNGIEPNKYPCWLNSFIRFTT